MEEGERPVADWTLIVLDGPEAGRRYSLGARSRLGRNPGLEIVVRDPQASRQHALIQCAEDGTVVSDAGSRNGTFVNGARVSQPTRLNHGDTIRVGNTWLQVERQEGSVPAPARSASPAPAASPVGRPAPSAAPAASPGPATTAEPVLGVITGLVRRKGVFGSQGFNMVVTPQRLVFDRITNEMLNDAVRQARQAAREAGRGLLGQWGAQAGAFDRLAQQYFRTPVEALLQRHADNFAIAAQQIRKVSLRASDIEQNRPAQIVIHGPAKLRFDLKGTGVGQTNKILRQVLGHRVR